MQVETSPAAFLALVSMFSSPSPSLPGPPMRDRRRANPFVCNGFRKLSWCSIVAVATIGLIAMSFVMAAPAAADGRQGTDSTDQAATSASDDPADRSESSSGHSEHNGADDVPSPAADPSPPEALAPWEEPGHDRCKKQKGNRRLLPWCTDSGAGWVGSTTLRVRPNAAAPPGMCDAIGFRPSPVCQRVGPSTPK
jgi:hypothetical protein